MFAKIRILTLSLLAVLRRRQPLLMTTSRLQCWPPIC